MIFIAIILNRCSSLVLEDGIIADQAHAWLLDAVYRIHNQQLDQLLAHCRGLAALQSTARKERDVDHPAGWNGMYAVFDLTFLW